MFNMGRKASQIIHMSIKYAEKIKTIRVLVVNVGDHSYKITGQIHPFKLKSPDFNNSYNNKTFLII